MPHLCVISGCERRTGRMFRFPNPREDMTTYNEWVKLIGVESLKTRDPVDVYNKCRVCEAHFSKEEVFPHGRLFRYAKPSLYLPERQQESPPNDVIIEENDGIEEDAAVEVEVEEIFQSVAEETQDEHRSASIGSVTTPSSSGFGSVLHKLGVNQVKDLTPKAQKLYRRIRKLSKTLHKLRRKSRKLQRIVKSKMIVENVTATLPKAMAQFVNMQIELNDRKPQGRRYDLDSKIFGLILQKQGPKTYNFLRRAFILPSPRTNSTLLKRIPIVAGINESVFDNLELIVRSMEDRDKVAVLMFDEMSIEPQVNVNCHMKEFEGFEDMGDTVTSKICDHACVFMLKGITQRWKKPLCYTFCRGATTTYHLVHLISIIIDHCARAGLQIVATISDFFIQFFLLISVLLT